MVVFLFVPFMVLGGRVHGMPCPYGVCEAKGDTCFLGGEVGVCEAKGDNCFLGGEVGVCEAKGDNGVAANFFQVACEVSTIRGVLYSGGQMGAGKCERMMDA